MRAPSLRPWDAQDELWYRYRDPVAEGVPGSFERLRSLRTDGGWNVPFKGKTVFLADGSSDLVAEVTREYAADLADEEERP